METRSLLTIQVSASKPDCKVSYKGTEHKGIIMETKMDKIKVKILGAAGEVLKMDWYDKKEVKRIW